MSVTTEEDAATDMFNRIASAFDAGAEDIVGYVPDIRWPFVAEPATPNRSKHWARVWKANDNSKQRSLGIPALYTTTGLLYVQIFSPPIDKQAGDVNRALGLLVVNAFRGISAGSPVWYRQVTMKEMLPETLWLSRRVQTAYSFDELR